MRLQVQHVHVCARAECKPNSWQALGASVNWQDDVTQRNCVSPLIMTSFVRREASLPCTLLFAMAELTQRARFLSWVHPSTTMITRCEWLLLPRV